MDNHPEIISRLKFIGKLQKGDKINTRKMFVQSEGIITKLVRTLIRQDNRLNTLSFVQETIRRSFDLLEIYHKSSEMKFQRLYQNMIKDLQDSVNGINNLKNTYCDDIKFCCDMDTLLQLIIAKLGDDGAPDNYSIIPQINEIVEISNSREPLKEKLH
tara:strand:+ start:2474 stop:2947 length:474 start_codon:yes stop_codon:yes gene_type:complete